MSGTVLITGGGGFIGSPLADELEALELPVRHEGEPGRGPYPVSGWEAI